MNNQPNYFYQLIEKLITYCSNAAITLLEEGNLHKIEIDLCYLKVLGLRFVANRNHHRNQPCIISLYGVRQYAIIFFHPHHYHIC